MTTIDFGATRYPSSPTRLRLTTRGRVVLTALVAGPLVAAALAFGINGGGAIATGDAGTESFTWVSVEAGQSLWDIAATVAPDADPREFVADLVSLNQLSSADVRPGERLAIPEEYVR